MPIALGVYKVCYEDANLKREAMALMSRGEKDENEGLDNA